MPSLNLSAEAAKLRFRTFAITLPASTQYAPGTLSRQLAQRHMGQYGVQAGPGNSAQRVTGLGGSASRSANLVVAPAATKSGARFGAHSAAGSGSSAGSTSGSSSSAGSNSSDFAPANPMPFPPALFRAGSNTRVDVDAQIAYHNMWNAIFDGVFDAIKFGFDMWRLQAKFADVTIEAIDAIGGRIDGPDLAPLIKRAPSVAAWGDSSWESTVLDAVARGFAQQWSILCDTLRVPALPWYPAFAAFPGPQAPPMPNIPMPFMTLAFDRRLISPYSLKLAMSSIRTGSRTDYLQEFYDSVSLALSAALELWFPMQPYMLVMGKGPIPTFAPPYVPVGPVVGGSIISMPGHFLA